VRARVLAYLHTHMYLVHTHSTYIRTLFIRTECLCLRPTPGTV
jgi:hypothetical protein